MRRRDDLVEHLGSVGLFSRCSKGELKTVARHVEEMTFSAGDELCLVGEEGDALFVILTGTVVVQGPKEVVLGPGDHVGELSLLDRKPRTATVVAQEEVRTAALGIRMFRTLLREFPSISEQLLAGLAGELRAAREERRG